MTNPNTLPSMHEVQSAIHRVRCIRRVLAEGLARISGKSVSAFHQTPSRNTNLFDDYSNPAMR
ncbi:hypothetical protein [Ruegeria meonggei]|uniref:hypothetical protein n=1 Tax=Ruegeria meonggei TaxID=1446476 RepID=UPI003671E68D